MHHRGRSRHVSPVALARQASEERRLHDARVGEHEGHRRDHEPFQYTFMPPLAPRTPRPARRPAAARSVSFKEVVAAMNGRLFPLDPAERANDARRIAGVPIAATKRRASVRAELLDSLLQLVEWHDGERRRAKGKDVVRPVKSPAPPLPASVPSVPSRSSSWLSFGSWRSTATDLTAPDSSLASPVASCPPCLPAEPRPELRPRSALVRVSLQDSPLGPPAATHHRPVPDSDLPASPPIRTQSALVKRVTRSVASIVEVARGLQSAYMTATMFAAGPTHYLDPASPSAQPRRSQPQLRRDGYRALAKDVQTFTDQNTPISHTCEPVHFIPLVSLPSASPALPKPPVPKNVVIFPSPLRPRTPPAVLAYRMRPVANPAVLRLRALQNLMYARGKEWEGRAREGGLGCGKERMLGVAFEGRGRSGLGCEVRFVVA